MNLESIRWVPVLSSSTTSILTNVSHLAIGVFPEPETTKKIFNFPVGLVCFSRWRHVSNIFGMFTPKIGEDVHPLWRTYFFKWVGENRPTSFCFEKAKKSTNKKETAIRQRFSAPAGWMVGVGVVGGDCIWLVQLVPVKSVKSPRPFAFGDLFFYRRCYQKYIWKTQNICKVGRTKTNWWWCVGFHSCFCSCLNRIYIILY